MGRIAQIAVVLLTLQVAVFSYGNGAPIEPPETKIDLEAMTRIPAGEFIMGSNKIDTEMLQQRFGLAEMPYLNEHPERKVYLDEYYIDTYEVTNQEYKAFLDEMMKIFRRFPVSDFLSSTWKNGTYPEGEDNLPVAGISWDNAVEFCKRQGKRLPTEAEWEKAARGTDGREFPWGDEFDETKANSMGKYGGIAPVGQFAGDVSPYGVRDMGGNVREWVQDWYKSYPGNEFLYKHYGEKQKVVRGGDWGSAGHYVMPLYYRAAAREHVEPEAFLEIVGFRCVYSTAATAPGSDAN